MIKSIQDLKKTLNEKDSSIFVICGTDRSSINSAVEEVYASIENREYNVQVFDADITEADDIMTACETSSFFMEKRLVHIKQLKSIKKLSRDAKTTEKIETRDKLIFEYLTGLSKNVPDKLYVLVSFEGEADISNKKIGSFLNSCTLMEFKAVKGKDVAPYIKDIIEKNGKSINSSDISYFINEVGQDISKLNSELEKLLSYTGSDEVITKEHIDAIVTRSLENNIFKMVESITKKDADTAVKILNTLLFQKEEYVKILGMITRQLRLCLQILVMTQDKVSEREIKAKLNLGDYAYGSISKLLRYCKVHELKRGLELCLKADYNIKSGKLPSEAALELLVVNLCG